MQCAVLLLLLLSHARLASLICCCFSLEHSRQQWWKASPGPLLALLLLLSFFLPLGGFQRQLHLESLRTSHCLVSRKISTCGTWPAEQGRWLQASMTSSVVGDGSLCSCFQNCSFLLAFDPCAIDIAFLGLQKPLHSWNGPKDGLPCWNASLPTRQTTKDFRILLPSSIQRVDPTNQLRTNAHVLSFLLRAENRQYDCLPSEDNRRLGGESFLKYLSKSELDIQVLLDVGAQMLDLSNQDVARTWLSHHSPARGEASCLQEQGVEAATFFEDSDELTVLERDGSTTSLNSSPYREKLDRCLVHLDDAHT